MMQQQMEVSCLVYSGSLPCETICRMIWPGSPCTMSKLLHS